MKTADVDFYERRANEETVIALACADRVASAIHRELARMYRDRGEAVRRERDNPGARSAA